jgi:hypothetical protein
VGGLLVSTNLIKIPNAVAGVYVLLPAGAVLFGLFLISKALEKEVTRYDEEQKANRNSAQRMEEKDSHAPDHPPIHHHERLFARSH